MSKADDYRRALRELADWEPYLLAHSGLPGPRANLELMGVAADDADEATLRRWAAGGGAEYLALCGVVGLGRLAAAGDASVLEQLRSIAGDPRWRMREAVAMALQRVGDRDFDRLLATMREWERGTALERRAAVVALCEPRLLRDPVHAGATLELLDRVTRTLPELPAGDERKTLRKALGYGWSVAVVALPDAGKPRFERLLALSDRDIRWIVRENLRKKRLERMDAGWTARLSARAAR